MTTSPMAAPVRLQCCPTCGGLGQVRVVRAPRIDLGAVTEAEIDRELMKQAKKSRKRSRDVIRWNIAFGRAIGTRS